MFIFAHIAAGLIAGKLSGNYPIAMAGTIFPDIDHLVSYARHKIIFNPKKLWNKVTDEKDRYGDQRNFLHNLIITLLISASVVMINFEAGIAFSLAYLSHILLDSLDSSDFKLFYPLGPKINGPIAYLSRNEFFFTIMLFLAFLLI